MDAFCTSDKTDKKNPKCIKSHPPPIHIKIPFYPDFLPKTEAQLQIFLTLKGTCPNISLSNPSCCISDFEISPTG